MAISSDISTYVQASSSSRQQRLYFTCARVLLFLWCSADTLLGTLRVRGLSKFPAGTLAFPIRSCLRRSSSSSQVNGARSRPTASLLPSCSPTSLVPQSALLSRETSDGVVCSTSMIG